MIIIGKFSVLKTVLLSMVVALSASVVFGYKLYEQSQETKAILVNQRNSLIADLKSSKDSLDKVVTENDSLKIEILIEKQKVINLLKEIDTDEEYDIEAIMDYRKEIQTLKQSIASLAKQRDKLKINNEILKEDRDSTILVLTNAKKYTQELEDLNTNLSKTIKKASTIAVVNLKSNTFKQNNRGELEFTDKARKVDLLQVSFILVGHNITKSIDKEYYVQIIDSKNNIVGDKKTIKIGSTILDYSFTVPVKFQNDSMEVSADLAMSHSEKGTYWVNVFDKGKLVSKTTFELR